MLATNAGAKHSNQEAVTPGFGKVCFNKDAMANIFAFSDLKKRHRITHDSDKKDAFAFHEESKIIKFECGSEGLHQHEASKDCKKDTQVKQHKDGTSDLIGAVTENRKGHAMRQFECAKEARKLHHIVGGRFG
jgi:hypothetical protein